MRLLVIYSSADVHIYSLQWQIIMREHQTKTKYRNSSFTLVSKILLGSSDSAHPVNKQTFYGNCQLADPLHMHLSLINMGSLCQTTRYRNSQRWASSWLRSERRPANYGARRISGAFPLLIKRYQVCQHLLWEPPPALNRSWPGSSDCAGRRCKVGECRKRSTYK